MYKTWKTFGRWWLNAVAVVTVVGLGTALVVKLFRHVPIG
jgi:hypothetical protein